MGYSLTSQAQVRAAFWQGWENRPRPRKLANGDYPTDVRIEFLDFIDMLARDRLISSDLAQFVTLT